MGLNSIRQHTVDIVKTSILPIRDICSHLSPRHQSLESPKLNSTQNAHLSRNLKHVTF